ncbi:MAG: hypothetical protein CL908_16500 [Deltaproteobacteria bacterium]|jgi:hypothetical protein|nr:hypothetical protein [Deltaproteobacteria bacterium]
MRYLVSLSIAVALVFLVFWVGARIVDMVSGPHLDRNEFTVGRKLDLCGHPVDIRHEMSGYDLDEWRGEGRCDALSDLDRCVLRCLSEAGTVEIGRRCWTGCLAK